LVRWSAAQELGLPLVPPSLSHNASFSHGANFAATALDVSFFKDTPIARMLVLDTTLKVQLKWFESLKSLLCSPAQGNQLLAQLIPVVRELFFTSYTVGYINFRVVAKLA
jgi:hypothetical protein